MLKGILFKMSRSLLFGLVISKIYWKPAMALLILIDIGLFGAPFLQTVGHALHVLIEVIESLADHFLADVIGLSHHTAEIVTAYTGLAIVLVLLFRLVRALGQLCSATWESAVSYYQRVSQALRIIGEAQRWSIPLTAAGLLTMAYLFMF